MLQSRIGPPPLPLVESPWRVRAASVRDAGLVSRWMNEPHVAAAWHQAWSVARWAAELGDQLAHGHSLPCLVYHHDEPFAYVEIYRVVRDRLACYYAAGSHDLGVHVAIGDVEKTGRGLGSRLLRAVAEGLLAADRACERVVAEPNVDNLASTRAFTNAGFRQVGQIQLPHKTAALLVRAACR